MKKNVILHLHGRVQGVSFRYYTLQQARLHGIRGFVQNRPDGSVYIEAEGEEEKLDAFIRWCHNGPPWAIVENIEITEQQSKNFTDFTIREGFGM
ncbi:MAG TPA: acylphosphatase [Bacteroidales bacterium]|nr:acylphosphatase [Bacteroidales bacterium]HNS47386.1 acylphosphatase [Bacteroidales bacterium]